MVVLLLVVLGTQLMNGRNKCSNVFRIDFGVDTMTQVEYVAIAFAVTGQYCANFCADTFRVGVEDTRVHVTLQGDVVPGEFTCIIKVDGPIDAEAIGSGGGHFIQPASATFGEENDGNLAAVGVAGKAVDNLLHVVQ